jgi:hypothetical protein
MAFSRFQVGVSTPLKSSGKNRWILKLKPNHMLTTNDVRLVVNLSPLNDHLKNIPSPKTTNDIFVTLGELKHII